MKIIKRRLLAAVFAWVMVTASAGAADLPTVHVYKTATCGCCSKWVDHLESNGFPVEFKNVNNIDRIKAEKGVPRFLSSCHTATVDGYVVEGHVPAEDIFRLLKNRPKVAGIAVPRMPIGSPGMEGPNPQRYKVFSFDPAGNVEEFATHGPK